MKQYLDTMRNIYENGVNHEDRTGVGRRSIFGVQDRYNIEGNRLPLVTTRKIFTKGLIYETLWFISGGTNTQYLLDNNVRMWDKWALDEEAINAFIEKYFPDISDEEKAFHLEYYKQDLNSIGPLYGYNWRNAPNDPRGVNILWPDVPVEEIPSDKIEKYKQDYIESGLLNQSEQLPFEKHASMCYYETYDQLNELIRNLKHRPHSSRLVVNAWIPAYVPFEGLPAKENILLGKSALTACHTMFQVFVHPAKEEGGKKRLSLMMTQRSADYPVGSNYNIAQYALLAMLLAHVSDMEPFEFIYSIGDCHIYLDQLPLIEEQLSREPLESPTVWLNPEQKDLFQFKPEDIRIENYQHHSEIKYPVAA